MRRSSSSRADENEGGIGRRRSSRYCEEDEEDDEDGGAIDILRECGTAHAKKEREGKENSEACRWIHERMVYDINPKVLIFIGLTLWRGHPNLGGPRSYGYRPPPLPLPLPPPLPLPLPPRMLSGGERGRDEGGSGIRRPLDDDEDEDDDDENEDDDEVGDDAEEGEEADGGDRPPRRYCSSAPPLPPLPPRDGSLFG